jgi:uncharacterized membrane protein HdeD (DUF308 family)
LESVAFVMLGVAAIGLPYFAGALLGTLFGWVMITRGIVGLVATFAARLESGFSWPLVSAVVAIAAGSIVAVYRLTQIMDLIQVVGVWLGVEGFVSMFTAMHFQRSGQPSWGWPVVSAYVDWLFTIAMLMVAPIGGYVFVGAVIGISLVIGGVTRLLAICPRPRLSIGGAD